MPPRPRKRAVPRPAPIVHEDKFTDAALHARPQEPARKRSRTTAPAPPLEAPAPSPAAHDGTAAEEVLDHQALAPPPRPAPRRPGLIPTEIADSIGPVLGKAVADIKAARPALDKTATDRLRGDVRELAGTLGVIRDHDVMIDRLHQEAARLGDPDTGALEHLISRLETERVAGRDRLVTELDDPSYQELLAELEGAAAQPPVADPWADLHELAAAEWRTLRKARRKLHKTFGENPPDDDLHELRIYGKRSRYAAELLHGKGEIAAFLDALAGLQEVLGDHQDACVLEDRLRELVVEVGDPRAGLAAGRVIQGCRDRRVEARAAYPEAWKKAEAAARKAFPD